MLRAQKKYIIRNYAKGAKNFFLSELSGEGNFFSLRTLCLGGDKIQKVFFYKNIFK